MKQFSFLVAFVGIIFANIVSAIFIMDKPVMDECVRIESATDVDLKEIHLRHTNLSKTGQCLLACTFEKSGIIGENGKVSFENLRGFITLRYGRDERAVQTINEVAEVCTAEVTDVVERCELATKLRQCVLVTADGRKLETRRPERQTASL